MAILTTSLTSVSTVTEMDVHAKGHILYYLLFPVSAVVMSAKWFYLIRVYSTGQAWINFIINQSIQSALLLPKLQGLCSLFM